MSEIVVARDDGAASLRGRVVEGRYLLDYVVGSGGFGVVYRATHLRFDSPIAVKVMRVRGHHDAAERQRFVERFVREGKMLFGLGALHPSIVRVFETGTVECADGSIAPYLAMEWLEGLSLEREIARRRELGQPTTSLREMIGLLEPAVEALAAAHRARIAHRDVKPGNLFLSCQDQRVTSKLLDFGLAKAVNESATTTSRFADTGYEARSFTPSYAAPEQWLRRLGATGPWTDVHALALVCVELLSGRRPFHGDPAQLMAACLDGAQRPTPRALGVVVSEGVERTLRKALAIEPRERFADASAFWQALRSSAGVDTKDELVSAVALRTRDVVRLEDAAAPTESWLRDRSRPAPDASPPPAAVLAVRHLRVRVRVRVRVALVAALTLLPLLLVAGLRVIPSSDRAPNTEKRAHQGVALPPISAQAPAPPSVEATASPAPVAPGSAMHALASTTTEAPRAARRLQRRGPPARSPSSSASPPPAPAPALARGSDARSIFKEASPIQEPRPRDDLLDHDELTRRY